MATKQEISKMIDLLECNKRNESFAKLQHIKQGMEGVLRILSNNDKPIKSKEISDELCISTARMAVLLKKMEHKGLITKETSISDARNTMVSLTKAGKKEITSIKEGFLKVASKIHDEIGYENMEMVFSVLDKIDEIIANTKEIRVDNND